MAEHVTEDKNALPYRQDIFAGRTEFRVSEHALREAHKEGIRAKDIVFAIFKGEVVERYPERRRVLVSAPFRNTDLHVHVVCDYSDYSELVAVTVYIPTRAEWASHKQRRQWGKSDA